LDGKGGTIATVLGGVAGASAAVLASQKFNAHPGVVAAGTAAAGLAAMKLSKEPWVRQAGAGALVGAAVFGAVTLAVRDIVRDCGARLFYYAERKEIEFANAIDAAMTFIKGTGHQMELEAIRGRVREALRARVRAGRIAGGRCYGYELKRETDSSGRNYTIAVVNEEQAAIVRRIYAEYRAGDGLKRIVSRLNKEHIAPPRAGRRGTGSWCPSAIREMLRNARFRGVYIHGRTNRVRRGARRIAVEAPPEDIIALDVPEWRIVDDATWFAVQELFQKRPQTTPRGQWTRYALSGLARCAVCGGSIGTQNQRLSKGRHGKVYGCTRHYQRGDSVCPVKHRQDLGEVEAAVADHILNHFLVPEIVDEIVAQLRTDLTEQLAVASLDVDAIEAELARVRSEQRNLALAVASGGDSIPELVGEMRRSNERIRVLEADLASARRTPSVIEGILRDTRGNAERALADMRALLQSPADAREVYEALFPQGLVFSEGLSADGSRRV
jgi:hypothetical protein